MAAPAEQLHVSDSVSACSEELLHENARLYPRLLLTCKPWRSFLLWAVRLCLVHLFGAEKLPHFFPLPESPDPSVMASSPPPPSSPVRTRPNKRRTMQPQGASVVQVVSDLHLPAVCLCEHTSCDLSVVCMIESKRVKSSPLSLESARRHGFFLLLVQEIDFIFFPSSTATSEQSAAIFSRLLML